MVIRTLTLNPCLDVFYRLPRLVPGEVNRADEPTPRAGGKGVNVSREVLRQGMQTCAYVLFAGENGRRLASLLQREGIHFVAEWVEGETRTNLAIATDAESYKINTHGPDGAAEGAALLVETFVEECQNADIAVISGSLPPGVPPNLVAQAISALKARNIPTWLDASGELLRVGINARPSGIKPNIEEIQELCIECQLAFDHANPTAAAEAIRAKFELDEVLLTLGADGAARISAEGAAIAPAPEVRSGHATGAGDAFLGAYLCARARGMEGGDALKEAVAAGGKAMMTTPSFAEATARLREERRKAEKNRES